MAVIYETPNFFLESKEKPEIDRLDGGHLVINPKVSVLDRTHLFPELAIELMRLTIASGKAMTLGLGKRWIHIGRINYQDNGNWRKELHIHLYGRSIDSVYQKFWDPIISGNRPEYNPLNEGDISAIQKELEEIFSSPEFSDSIWRLN